METEKNYHDYVIKEGKFIGDFETMYRECKDPWTQSTQPNNYSRLSGILHMRNFGINSLVECGCGLGYYAEWVYRETGIVPKSIDISETAIERANALFPHLDFKVGDITNSIENYKSYDCILLSEIIWYILPDLDQLFKTLKEHFSGKYLMVNQVFYKGTQKYGNDYFTSMEEMIKYFPFDCVAKVEATQKTDTTIETSVLFQI
ncbi:class I SAM-dependent methyltransferase [Flammeovirga aprica]|uniref:Class I SAM-dependent methyltransferase n=1 Tax=Flammeovirga aprica JL-4 TaxID=694437 RepID=A0A7X9XCV3_9BACT|nr:class I SAM-dependent methyltransferase [Flammeovirga aprica]NME72207.1 class I SAM-dependent methyltransferase [Flammeovirga aprica JL-4]